MNRCASHRPASKRIALGLLLAFIAIWGVLAIRPWYREDWLLENVIVFLAVPGLVLGYFRRPISTAAYAMIFVFLVLHEIGAHYTYAEVPYDAWWTFVTGHSFNASVGWERNHFDRLLHLLFGVLITYPLRELLIRTSSVQAQGAWSYVIPVLMVMSGSMCYEMIEWGAATVFGGDLGMAYLGTQGDVWDAHKDMACAIFGAVASMLLLAAIRPPAFRP